MRSIWRADDFKSVLDAIGNGKLIDNIVLNLLQDVGKLPRQGTSVKNMRYSKTSLDFGTMVEKLFKGKAVSFFQRACTRYKKYLVIIIHVLQYEIYFGLMYFFLPHVVSILI